MKVAKIVIFDTFDLSWKPDMCWANSDVRCGFSAQNYVLQFVQIYILRLSILHQVCIIFLYNREIKELLWKSHRP